MKKFITLIYIVGLFLTINTSAQKSNIRVLVVAHNPAKEYTKSYSGPKPGERRKELANKRGEEYKQFLNNYFKTVDVVYSESYRATMSNNYDVTIMDDLPVPIDTLDFGLYRNGKSIIRGGKPMMYPRYLPEDFDRALIVIGDQTDDLAYMIPSKFMTQCHCIQFGYGLNTKSEHAIFNKPEKVDLDLVKVKTPSNFKKYYSGKDLPNEIDVWWAQTESSGDRNGYWVGQILTGLGFDDSPDCEFISGSNSVKDISGMALGRNGNMFHWGFSASPAFMTEQAKKIFVNTIHYMAQFNDKPTITQYKSNSRLWANEWCYRNSHQLLDTENEYISTGNAVIDSTYLYYKDNYPYFYMEGMGVTPIIDEGAKSLNIANNNPQLLEQCINMLEKGEDTEMALLLLKRYTEFNYTSAKEWERWYKTYKDYLFFTELGGYKFMIDTYNHPELKGQLSIDKIKPKVQVVSSVRNNEDKIVKIEGTLLSISNDNYNVALNLDIKERWHIYADMPDDGMFIKTKISFELPEGVTFKGVMTKPLTHKYEELDGVTLYKGKSLFEQGLNVDNNKYKGQPIVCKVYYQACDAYMCKPPVEQQIKLVIK